MKYTDICAAAVASLAPELPSVHEALSALSAGLVDPETRCPPDRARQLRLVFEALAVAFAAAEAELAPDAATRPGELN